MPSENNRLLYFDVMKGVAIFMVVMGHIITMCIRDIDRTPLFKFIGEIHMPLFFFISGWFGFGWQKDGLIKKPKLGTRAKQLLIPMVIVSSLWIWYFPHSGLQSPLISTFKGLWLSPSKNGYWFTLVLFEIILLYAAVTPWLGKISKIGAHIFCGVVVWLMLIGLALIFSCTVVDGCLGLTLVATYWPAFFAGVTASRFRNGFENIITKPSITFVALLIGAMSLYYICWWWEFHQTSFLGISEFDLVLVRPIFHICLAVVAIALFKPMVSQACILADKTPRWVRLWSYLGVNSLGIYLLHYFFLFPLGDFRNLAFGMNLGFVPMLFVSMACAAAIIAVVLATMRVLAICPPLYFLLTGTKVR